MPIFSKVVFLSVLAAVYVEHVVLEMRERRQVFRFVRGRRARLRELRDRDKRKRASVVRRPKRATYTWKQWLKRCSRFLNMRNKR